MSDPTPRTPRFLTPPPPATYENSPELRRLVWFGGFLLLALVVTLVLKFTVGSKEPEKPVEQAPPPPPVESPEERQKRVESMFDGALTRVTDGTDFDQSVAYLDVVREVAQSDLDLFHGRTRQDFDWRTAMNQPAVVRGNFYEMRGTVGDLQVVKLFQPAGKVEDVYRFVLDHRAGNEPCVIDLVVRPDRHLDERRATVDVDAVFLRTVKFETGKNKVIEMPYLIGRTVSVVEIPDSGPQGPWRWALLGGVVVVALLIARTLFKSNPVLQRRGDDPTLRKPGVGIREMFEMRRREDELARKRAEAAGSPEPKKEP